jgi:hypothetical protein
LDDKWKGSFPKNSEPSRQQETKLEEVIQMYPLQFQNLLFWNLFLKKSSDKNKVSTKNEDIQNAVNESLSVEVENCVLL